MRWLEEWIQKLHRDKRRPRCGHKVVRRMPADVSSICPPISETHANFQRVPTVDTSKLSFTLDEPATDGRQAPGADQAT